ncbi:polysaccharide deacetylase family sporulation protein PdaB [Sulfobacillus thermosulfidooxidans DSM 9293]|uniref:Polysaccharide deacetylase family sporulation protein PdaB n=1 Tax=Sulfobacillus thermosulfidooxidans (strain DSM 9293 / VKM B-1269 / AT-1) TaxID=929705 RepID=A0A1W1WM90_SULTA|nr:polysaccharide deacetylase family protein [Sulfobacillus thermosulfidooxidans]SMC07140.1 polysaccharide deacetylase family sporulation protein PdaB [Sulfobacillus thermosulfidooxidans DSM 9293]
MDVLFAKFANYDATMQDIAIVLPAMSMKEVFIVRIVTVSRKVLRYVIVAVIMATVMSVGLWATDHDMTTSAHAATLPAQDRYSLRDVETNQKVAALTFDISWGTVMPPKVLAILKTDHVPATIFVSGPWAKQHPDIVKAYAQAGIEVESHGWAHVNYSGLSNQGIVDNLMKTDQVIQQITGQKPSFVRPPNGDFNSRSILAARSVGYTTVTWGTDSLDWMNPGVATIIRRVTTRIHPGDIILMHASDTCKQTDIALPTILQSLREKGYKLVTLKQLLTYGKPIYRG